MDRVLQLHHVIHWIDGGTTAYRNLAVLCSAHHRAHHAGRFHVVYDPREPGDFRFHLTDGGDSDGEGRQVEYAPRLPTPTGAIADQHTAAITPDTIQPNWYGDSLNLDYAVDVMTQHLHTRN